MDVRHLSTGRVMRSAMLAVAISALGAPGAAFAGIEPNRHASCMGIEHAAISPPGTSDEEPGGSRQFVGEIKALATLLGLPPGAIFRFVASLHAGSHADCDEALEG
jgi:hypothetical protein